MFVAGMLLSLNGVSLKIGIALIAAGAVALVAPSVLDTTAGLTTVTDMVQDIMAIGGPLLIAAGLLLIASGMWRSAWLCSRPAARRFTARLPDRAR